MADTPALEIMNEEATPLLVLGQEQPQQTSHNHCHMVFSPTFRENAIVFSSLHYWWTQEWQVILFVTEKPKIHFVSRLRAPRKMLGGSFQARLVNDSSPNEVSAF